MQPDLKRHYDLIDRLRNAPASQQETVARELVRFVPHSIRGFRADYEHRKHVHELLQDDGARQTPDLEPFKLPQHPGFQRLAINAEKVKDYDLAIAICREASDLGWAGDWDKRIERCEVKKSKLDS